MNTLRILRLAEAIARAKRLPLWILEDKELLKAIGLAWELTQNEKGYEIVIDSLFSKFPEDIADRVTCYRIIEELKRRDKIIRKE